MVFFLSLSKALRYSLSGLKYICRERAFRQELLLGITLGLVVWLFDLKIASLLYSFGAYLLVLIAECFNSAIESLSDRIGLEYNDLSKRAKDISSAAVFLALVHFFGSLMVTWIVK
jgi:diacylglycerol kinase (ATP)